MLDMSGELDIDVRSREPSESLLAEHAEARRFCALALELLRCDAEDLEKIASTSARLLHYFGEELARHEADEEAVVARALVTHDRRVGAALGLLFTQHVMLRDGRQELLPTWRMLTEHPTSLARVRAELAAETSRMASMMESHLELEETVLLPRLRELPAAAKRAISERLRGRHT
jgi:hemerythrin-like domain-containing protein